MFETIALLRPLLKGACFENLSKASSEMRQSSCSIACHKQDRAPLDSVREESCVRQSELNSTNLAVSISAPRRYPSRVNQCSCKIFCQLEYPDC